MLLVSSASSFSATIQIDNFVVDELNTVTIPAGLSLFALPAVMPTGTQASALAAAINSAGGQTAFVGRISEGGQFQSFIPGLGSGDFAIETSRGYLLSLSRAATITLSGDATSAATPATLRAGLNIVPVYAGNALTAATLLQNLNLAANRASGTIGARYCQFVVIREANAFRTYVDGIGQGDFALPVPCAAVVNSATAFTFGSAPAKSKALAKAAPAKPNARVAKFYADITNAVSRAINTNARFDPIVMDIADQATTVWTEHRKLLRAGTRLFWSCPPALSGKWAPQKNKQLTPSTIELQINALDIHAGNLQYALARGPKNAAVNQQGLFRFTPTTGQAGTHTIGIAVWNAKNPKSRTIKNFTVRVAVRNAGHDPI